LGAYLIRRLLLMILTLFGISVIIFYLLRVVPGNIADILFDAAGMVNPAEKQKLEIELGLDKPIPIQYINWAVIDHQAELTRAGAKVGGLWGSLVYFLRRYPLGAAGAVIVITMLLMAIFAGWITHFDPTATNSRISLARPGGDHPLGADFMGRDKPSPRFFEFGCPLEELDIETL
jgi:hypothetical protein